jgi:CheY-like chemotaxis protein
VPSLTQTTRAYKSLTKDQQRFWKRILIVDDDADITATFKAAIEDSNNGNDVNKRIKVYTSNDPVVALSDFKPNYYDLLLVDINMPHMNGFELCEKILAVDINVKVCFMSSVEINRELSGLRSSHNLFYYNGISPHFLYTMNLSVSPSFLLPAYVGL